MKPIKVTYQPKTRIDISAPFHGVPYNDLLNKAAIKKFKGNFIIEELPDGKIIVKENPKDSE